MMRAWAWHRPGHHICNLKSCSSYSWWEAGCYDFLCNTKGLKASQSLKLNQMKLNLSYASSMFLLFSAFCSLCLFHILHSPPPLLALFVHHSQKWFTGNMGVNLLCLICTSPTVSRRRAHSPPPLTGNHKWINNGLWRIEATTPSCEVNVMAVFSFSSPEGLVWWNINGWTHFRDCVLKPPLPSEPRLCGWFRLCI